MYDMISQFVNLFFVVRIIEASNACGSLEEISANYRDRCVIDTKIQLHISAEALNNCVSRMTGRFLSLSGSAGAHGARQPHIYTTHFHDTRIERGLFESSVPRVTDQTSAPETKSEREIRDAVADAK
jgi:hypothetical protein